MLNHAYLSEDRTEDMVADDQEVALGKSIYS